MQYSVLMSVYHREKPEYLRQSMESIAAQTLPTDDFVLVCDGPLGPELEAVIGEMQRRFGPALQVVRLPRQGGLGRALNEGMPHCKNDIVARMDSDDIARPDRCEKELNALLEHGADIVSAGVEEFTDDPARVEVLRQPPQTHEEILAFAKKRNPFNHPCVLYRKSAVQAAGGYRDFYLLEDYYLWLRMLLNGSRGWNLQEPLLLMRAGRELYRRRGGWKYAVSQCRLFRFMRQQGLIGWGECCLSCAVRTVSSLLPGGLRRRLFARLLREKPAHRDGLPRREEN